MADIPHIWPGYIQQEESFFKSAVSEYTMTRMGSAMNYLYDFITSHGLAFTEFTSSGGWTVPTGVNNVLLIGCGGGSGGGYRNLPTRSTTVGSGGLGAFISERIVATTPGANYNITIGAGGAGVNNGGGVASGGAGGDTIFANSLSTPLITFHGAPSVPSYGTLNQDFYDPGTGYYLPTVSTAYTLSRALASGYSGDSPFYAKGADNTGYGGGAGAFGPGADGGTTGAGNAAGANTGAGGGGGGSNFNAPSGAGGSGRLIIIYNG